LGFSVSSCTETNPRLSVAKVRVLRDKHAAAAGPATSHRRRVKIRYNKRCLEFQYEKKRYVKYHYETKRYMKFIYEKKR
jgi:hypothetical protein